MNSNNLSPEYPNPTTEIMREYIIEVAQELADEKLLKMLYIRAKTIRNL